MNCTLRRASLTLACLCATAATAGPISAAQATPGLPATSPASLSQPASGAGCPSQSVSQPFTGWGDGAAYALVPGGDFESAAWTLSGGAQIVSGSERFAATGSLGTGSLSLPAGATAESGMLCIDSSAPSLRFFIAGTGSVVVKATFAGREYPLGVAHADGDWAPSPVVRTRGAFFGRLAGGPATVSLSFEALNGNPQVDDVFIDPWNRT